MQGNHSRYTCFLSFICIFTLKGSNELKKQSIKKEKMSEQASVFTSEDTVEIETSTEQITAALRKSRDSAKELFKLFSF